MIDYERWILERPELSRLEVLEELGGTKQLSPEEEVELEDLYRWRDEHMYNKLSPKGD